MKEKYLKLREKYGLPDYDELNSNFNISEIEKEELLLKNIAMKMVEKSEAYAKLFEELIHPEASLAGMYECNIFNALEKKRMFQVYKKLQFYMRFGLQNEIMYDEKSCAQYIKTLFKEWLALRIEINEFLEKMKQSWAMDLNNKMDQGYFG